jgi:copper homeostasis protein
MSTPPPATRHPLPVLVEVCIDSIASALAAQQGGASRIELCDDLVEGGTTPSAGMIALCVEKVGIPVFVIIRPRGGDFLYSDSEHAVMLRDIAYAKAAGVHGIVTGALTADGEVDTRRMRDLLDAARPLPVTFHRAIDQAEDISDAVGACIMMGVDRVLTSGAAPTAVEGIPVLSELVAQCGDQIAIMAGGSINEQNVLRVVRETGVREVHVRGTRQVPSAMRHRVPGMTVSKRFDPTDTSRMETDADAIHRMVEQLGGR